jgi:hypothetical protein
MTPRPATHTTPLVGLGRSPVSPYGGAHQGKWPFSIDPGDISRIWFQDPADNRWHALVWEHAPALDKPFSQEALAYARALAAKTDRFPDTKRALMALLDRWGTGLTANPTERRMAIRLSQERLRLLGTSPGADGEAVAELPSVRRVAALGDTAPAGGPTEPAGPAAEPGMPGPADGELGDDDADDDLDADPDTYYADAVEPLL